MANALDTANAKLQADQATLQSLQSQLNAATNDSNIASIRQKIATIQAHFGQNDPNDKHGYHYWISATGDMWSGTDADREWAGGLAAVTANSNLINSLNGQISNYTNNVIPQDTAAIQKLTAADPTIAAQANLTNAQAQAQVNTSKTVMYVGIGVVVIAIIVTIFLIKRIRRNKTS